MEDSSDFVRQAAFIGISLILIGTTSKLTPILSEFIKYLDKVYSDKYEDILCKMGSILSKGLLDFGGRNATIDLYSEMVHPKIQSIIGLVMFLQFWYWFPFFNMISLCITPLNLIALNSNLVMPKAFKVKSNAKPSLFAYPPPIQKVTEEEKKKPITAKLSTTLRAEKKRARKAEREKLMQAQGTAKHEEKKEESKEEHKVEKMVDIEPDSSLLENGERILKAQRKHLTAYEDSRYFPIDPRILSGIIIVKDNCPNEPEEFILGETSNANIPIPEEFVYDPLAQ